MQFSCKIFLLALAAPVFFFAQELFPFPENGKWGYINGAGRIVAAPEYETAGSFSGGLAKVGKVTNREFFYGFINGSGQEVIPPKFLAVSDFFQGLAAVQIRGKYAYLRPDGVISEGELFDEIFPVSEGMSRFKRGGLYGYVDSMARIVVPASFTEAHNFQDGMALVKVGGVYGFINTSGNFAVSPQYEAAESFKDGYAPVQLKRTWFLINARGERVGERTFDRVYPFSSGMARVRNGNLYGYIDRTGELVIPISFKEADDFSEGLAVVSSGNQLYGYLNTRGEMVAQPQFTRATRFDGRFARVSQGISHGFMNAEGKFNLTDKVSGIGSFFNNRARVKVGRFYGFFDETAKLRIKPVYLQAGEFRGALSMVLSAVPSGYRAAYINTAGAEVFSWMIASRPVPADKDKLFVISYPGVPFYKASDPESLVIVQMEYGAMAEKTTQRTATPLSGLGLEGLLYSVKYYSRPGFAFSEALSAFAPPRPGMGIFNYFQDKFGVLSLTSAPYAYDRPLFASFFNGSVLNRSVTRGNAKDTYHIPFMKLSEAFFLFSSALGYPASSFPGGNTKLENFLGLQEEAYFSASYEGNSPTQFSIRAGRERINVTRTDNGGIQLIHEYSIPANARTLEVSEPPVFGSAAETNEYQPQEPLPATNQPASLETSINGSAPGVPLT